MKPNKDVPLPAVNRRKAETKYGLENLDVGEHIFVPSEQYEGGAQASSVQAAVTRFNNSYARDGRKLATRTVKGILVRKNWRALKEGEQNDDAFPGVGVWRIA